MIMVEDTNSTNTLVALVEQAAEWGPAQPAPAEVPSGDVPARSPFNLNDDGNALRFAERYQGDLRYVRKQKQWYRWVGDRWAEDEVGAVVEMAREVSRRIADEAAGQSELRRGLILRWAAQSHNAARVHAMVDLAGSDARLALAPEQMNADPWLLNFPNGTVELQTGKLRPHDPNDLITKVCGAPFVPGAKHVDWTRFLRDATGGFGTDGDPKLMNFLQRMAGYSIVGDTREEVLAFVHGPTAAGKSTLAAAFAAALGDYVATAAFETFLEHRGGGGGGARGDIARLHGARIVNAVEVDEGKRFDSGVVKRMTGRDTVTARFNYKDDFEYRPQFTLWLFANHIPHIKPTDGGMWDRRVKIVPFIHTVPPADIDITLKTTLTDDPDVRTAVLAWMVEGCLKWQKDGLKVPKVVTDATKEKRREADHFAALSDDCLDFSIKFAWTSNAAIRYAADAWAKEQGLRYTIPQKKLTAKLIKGEATAGKYRGDRGWYGVTIVAGYEMKIKADEEAS